MASSQTIQSFLRDLLTVYTSLTPAVLSQVLSPTNLIELQCAFTSKTVDPHFNYEFYEILGDVTANKIVVWYFAQRFPQLKQQASLSSGNTSSVAIMARLKMNGISKRNYAMFARHLNLDKHIRFVSPRATTMQNASSSVPNKSTLKANSIAPCLDAPVAVIGGNYTTTHKPDNVCEDVFEAFIGCLEEIVNKECGPHLGYGVCYELMKKVMDQCCPNVSLDYSELYDPKSILNEAHKTRFHGKMNVMTEDIKTTDMFRSRYKLILNNKVIHVGQWGVAKNKQMAQQEAAKNILDSNILDTLQSGK